MQPQPYQAIPATLLLESSLIPVLRKLPPLFTSRGKQCYVFVAVVVAAAAVYHRSILLVLELQINGLMQYVPFFG